MNWLKIFRRKKNNIQNTEATDLNSHLIKLARKSTPLSALIQKEYFPGVAMELDRLKQAVALAKDPEHPDRTALYKIYEQTLRDLHLRAQIRTALYTIQFAPFEIRRNGYPDDDLNNLFDRTWFDQFIQYALEAEFWGHSLIEFSYFQNNEIKEITLIDRFHVVPELGIVKKSIYDDPTDGIKYTENPAKYNLIEIGHPYDIGLLELASIAVIWKNYALSDWAEFMDRYGMPFLVMRTNTSDPAELRKMQQAGEYFGLLRYIILNSDTQVEVLSPNANSYAYQTFDLFRQRMDEYISKLINGQTATSDEKAFVGAAEVQERILNKYTLARLRRIQRIINDQLFPLLLQLGYPLQNARFQYIDLENYNLLSQLDTEKKN